MKVYCNECGYYTEYQRGWGWEAVGGYDCYAPQNLEVTEWDTPSKQRKRETPKAAAGRINKNNNCAWFDANAPKHNAIGPREYHATRGCNSKHCGIAVISLIVLLVFGLIYF